MSGTMDSCICVTSPKPINSVGSEPKPLVRKRHLIGGALRLILAGCIALVGANKGVAIATVTASDKYTRILFKANGLAAYRSGGFRRNSLLIRGGASASPEDQSSLLSVENVSTLTMNTLGATEEIEPPKTTPNETAVDTTEKMELPGTTSYETATDPTEKTEVPKTTLNEPTIETTKKMEVPETTSTETSIDTITTEQTEISETTSTVTPIDTFTADKTEHPDKASTEPAIIESSVSDDPPLKEDARVMILIRLLFLTYYGSLGSLLPYLPVYYSSLGHGGQIIGMLGAVKPFTTFLVAPIWGMIADQSQRPFLILQVTFIVSLLGQLSVAFRKDAFYIMIMVFVTALFNAPVKSLIDSMVLDKIVDRSSYGRLRLWGQMGFGLGSSGVGILLSRSKHIPWPESTTFSTSMEDSLQRVPTALKHALEFANKGWQSLTGYKLLFFAHAALSIPTWLCIQAFRSLNSVSSSDESKSTEIEDAKETSPTPKKGGSRIGEGLRLLLHNNDALLFFFLVLVVGISSGVIENFAYVRIREVGGTGKEMGMSRLVSSLAGAPMFWFSGPLTEALGADRVIVLSLLSYVTRFIIYAFMKNPYHGLPAEALRGVTFAAFWSTGTIYAHRVSPPGLHATMLMFLNAMYGGLGQSLGALIGGKLQDRFGTVRTFLYSAGVDFCFVVLLIVYLSLRKESSFKNPQPIVARESKCEKVEDR